MKLRLLTPTYAPDLMRFRLLRESLLAAGCELPHLAVVQTEDLPAFKAVGFDDRVELVASADVLPPGVDAVRQRVHRRPKWLRKLRRSLNKRTPYCRDANYEGWSVQQIVKLWAAAQPGFDVTLSVDSDVLACGPWRLQDFVRNGEVALSCKPQDAILQPHWYAAAGKLLGLDPAGTPYWEYVAHPFAFHNERTRELLEFLESRHAGPWWQTLLNLRAGQLSEFTLYGRYLREIAGLKGCFVTPANARTRWVYTAEDRARVNPLIEACFADPSLDFMVLQSSTRYPVEPYTKALRSQFATLR